MNHKLSAAVLALLLCVAILLTGCQSSDGSGSELSSIEEDSNWADLNPEESPSAEPTITPTPTADVVTPELSQQEETEKDISEDYLGTFVGTWDNDGKTEIWTFSDSGSLVIEETADQSRQNWNWSVVEISGSSRLKLSSDPEDRYYSFTVNNGSTITLYDPDSGNASEVLTRVKDTEEEQPEVSTEPSQEPSAEPSAEASPEAAAQTEEPAASQEPAPSAEPSAEVSEEPTAEPEDQQNDDGTTGNASAQIEEKIIESSANYEALESVLDTLALGYGFDSTDPQSFWVTVASYLSKIQGEPAEDGYLYVSESQVENAGTEIYGSLDSIPECPSGSDIASTTSENGGDYRILWGQSGGHDTQYISYEGNEIIVEVDGTRYRVVTMPSGAVESVETVS